MPALTPGGRTSIAVLSVGWLITVVAFWWWWLLPTNHVSALGMILNSLLILYTTGLPIYFVVTVNRMRVVSPTVPISNFRVAMVVTKAPSEPWPVVETTLKAMLAQSFPYSFDVWLADEKPSEETLAWCDAHGVQLSTRFGDERYQRTTWPRRRKCKEGNLTYFYERYGYARYDIVS